MAGPRAAHKEEFATRWRAPLHVGFGHVDHALLAHLQRILQAESRRGSSKDKESVRGRQKRALQGEAHPLQVPARCQTEHGAHHTVAKVILAELQLRRPAICTAG